MSVESIPSSLPENKGVPEDITDILGEKIDYKPHINKFSAKEDHNAEVGNRRNELLGFINGRKPFDATIIDQISKHIDQLHRSPENMLGSGRYDTDQMNDREELLDNVADITDGLLKQKLTIPELLAKTGLEEAARTGDASKVDVSTVNAIAGFNKLMLNTLAPNRGEKGWWRNLDPQAKMYVRLAEINDLWIKRYFTEIKAKRGDWGSDRVNAFSRRFSAYAESDDIPGYFSNFLKGGSKALQGVVTDKTLRVPNEQIEPKQPVDDIVLKVEPEVVRPRIEKSVPKEQRWKFGREAVGTLNQEKVVNRRAALEQILMSSDSKDVISQARVWEMGRKQLNEFRPADVSPVLRAKMEDPKVVQRADELMQKLQRNELSPNELFQQNNSMQDLRALRLIGLTFLETGYKDSKDFSQLSEQNKRFVRLGEIIGLEAERGMIERMVSTGTLTQEQAQAAQKRYLQYVTNVDVPPVFAERFARTERLLRDRFQLPEWQRKEANNKITFTREAEKVPHPLPVPSSQLVRESNDSTSEADKEFVDVDDIHEQEVWTRLSRSIADWKAQPEPGEDEWMNWARKNPDQLQMLKDEAARRGTKNIQALWENTRKQAPPNSAAAA